MKKTLCLILASLAGYFNPLNIKAQDNFSGIVNAEVASKNILLSGKPQSEYPVLKTSASLSYGRIGGFIGVDVDKNETLELRSGIALKTPNLYGVELKFSLERKEMPSTSKEMYLFDVGLSRRTAFANLDFLLRQRFHNNDFEDGRTYVARLTTPKIETTKNSGLNGTVALSYQDQFIGNTSEWGYVTPGLNFITSLKGAEIMIYGRFQQSLREELESHFYGGIRISHKF